MTENEIGTIIVDAAITVHRELGPGLLETVYEIVLARELGEQSPPRLRASAGGHKLLGRGGTSVAKNTTSDLST